MMSRRCAGDAFDLSKIIFLLFDVRRTSTGNA
jgi:hypothetical protein